MDRKAVVAASADPARGAPPSPGSLPADGHSRWDDFRPFCPVSRETVRKWELEGRFPRRQHITQRCAIWANRELHRWMADPANNRAGG